MSITERVKEVIEQQKQEIEYLKAMLESGLKQCSKECMYNCVNYMGVRADAAHFEEEVKILNDQLGLAYNELVEKDQTIKSLNEQLVNATGREIKQRTTQITSGCFVKIVRDGKAMTVEIEEMTAYEFRVFLLGKDNIYELINWACFLHRFILDLKVES